VIYNKTKTKGKHLKEKRKNECVGQPYCKLNQRNKHDSKLHRKGAAKLDVIIFLAAAGRRECGGRQKYVNLT